MTQAQFSYYIEPKSLKTSAQCSSITRNSFAKEDESFEAGIIYAQIIRSFNENEWFLRRVMRAQPRFPEKTVPD